MVNSRHYTRRGGDSLAWEDEYGMALPRPGLGDSHANWDAASWSRNTVAEPAPHYPGPSEYVHAGRPCRCARCRVNWSLRSRILRGDHSVPYRSQLQAPHTTHQPSRFRPHNQSIHHDNTITMVGKVSERVLAREGKSAPRVDDDRHCAVADSSPSIQVSSAPTMA